MSDEQKKPGVNPPDNNDTAETWDHVCGPDPDWSAIMDGDGVEDE